jgi:hypothetical protein
MRHRLTLVALVIAAVGGAPRLATAAQCTADTVIDGCDRAFPRTTIFAEPLRGWCYLLGLANCALS